MTSAEQPERGQVSLIIPTANRNELLRETLPSYFSQSGVGELIIVNDSSTPLRPWFEATFPPPPVPIRIIDHPRSLGLCAARNSGIFAAHFPFIMFGEDDVILLDNYVKTLFEEYQRTGADLISGVFYRLLGDQTIEEAKARQRRNKRPTFDVKRLRVRPAPQIGETTEVLYTHALSLMKRELALAVLYDTTLGGPSFEREDNEFCLAARQLGARTFICPHAEAVHLPRTKSHGGGTRGTYSMTTSALSMVVNNFMFIERYFDVFREAGYQGSCSVLKARLAVRNVWDTLNRYLESENLLYRRCLTIYRKILHALRLR